MPKTCTTKTPNEIINSKNWMEKHDTHKLAFPLCYSLKGNFSWRPWTLFFHLLLPMWMVVFSISAIILVEHEGSLKLVNFCPCGLFSISFSRPFSHLFSLKGELWDLRPWTLFLDLLLSNWIIAFSIFAFAPVESEGSPKWLNLAP